MHSENRIRAKSKWWLVNRNQGNQVYSRRLTSFAVALSLLASVVASAAPAKPVSYSSKSAGSFVSTGNTDITFDGGS